jgi:hypothetical protein
MPRPVPTQAERVPRPWKASGRTRGTARGSCDAPVALFTFRTTGGVRLLNPSEHLDAHCGPRFWSVDWPQGSRKCEGPGGGFVAEREHG